jgi:hypothetical protein
VKVGYTRRVCRVHQARMRGTPGVHIGYTRRACGDVGYTSRAWGVGEAGEGGEDGWAGDSASNVSQTSTNWSVVGDGRLGPERFYINMETGVENESLTGAMFGCLAQKRLEILLRSAPHGGDPLVVGLVARVAHVWSRATQDEAAFCCMVIQRPT